MFDGGDADEGSPFVQHCDCTVWRRVRCRLRNRGNQAANYNCQDEDSEIRSSGRLAVAGPAADLLDIDHYGDDPT
jgi:hypothetical protein